MILENSKPKVKTWNSKNENFSRSSLKTVDPDKIIYEVMDFFRNERLKVLDTLQDKLVECGFSCSFSCCDDFIVLHLDDHIFVNTKDEIGLDGSVYHIWERVYITTNAIRKRELGHRLFRKWNVVQ